MEAFAFGPVEGRQVSDRVGGLLSDQAVARSAAWGKRCWANLVKETKIRVDVEFDVTRKTVSAVGSEDRDQASAGLGDRRGNAKMRSLSSWSRVLPDAAVSVPVVHLLFGSTFSRP